jgi:hypothetical protein
MSSVTFTARPGRSCTRPPSKAGEARVQKALSTAQAQFRGVRTSLSDANGRINVQSGQIETLKSCLNGVSIALNDVAYNDYSGAVSALDAVRVSCRAAYKIVG